LAGQKTSTLTWLFVKTFRRHLVQCGLFVLRQTGVLGIVRVRCEQRRRAIGNEPVVVVPFMDLKQPYYFLPYLGVDLRLDSAKQISEIVIAQISIAK